MPVGTSFTACCSRCTEFYRLLLVWGLQMEVIIELIWMIAFIRRILGLIPLMVKTSAHEATLVFPLGVCVVTWSWSGCRKSKRRLALR